MQHTVVTDGNGTDLRVKIGTIRKLWSGVGAVMLTLTATFAGTTLMEVRDLRLAHEKLRGDFDSFKEELRLRISESNAVHTTFASQRELEELTRRLAAVESGRWLSEAPGRRRQ